MKKSKTPVLRRAVKLPLAQVTGKKRRQIKALMIRYRSMVNFFIRSLWTEPGKLDKKTLGRLQNAPLSERYKSQALKQALEIVVATKKSAHELGKRASCPRFRGSAVLDAKFVEIRDHENSCFDLMIRLSSAVLRRKLVFPTKRTAVLNKWLEKPGAKLVQGCAISEDSLVVWVEFPVPKLKTEGAIVGIDIGINKLYVAHDGEHSGKIGLKARNVFAEVARKQAGSKSKARARRHRDQWIDRQVNKLHWNEIQVLVVEDLRYLKRGKKKNSKKFRKAAAPWRYRQVLQRMEQKAAENGVLFVRVNPAYTSQTCPSCDHRDRRNRHLEDFLCVSCGYQDDADIVGAKNVRGRYVRSLESWMPLNDCICQS